jgi:hypothetical protein
MLQYVLCTAVFEIEDCAEGDGSVSTSATFLDDPEVRAICFMDAACKARGLRVYHYDLMKTVAVKPIVSC